MSWEAIWADFSKRMLPGYDVGGDEPDGSAVSSVVPQFVG